jgi:hypothetical protein
LNNWRSFYDGSVDFVPAADKLPHMLALSEAAITVSGLNYSIQTDRAISAGAAAMNALINAKTNYNLESSILAAKQGAAKVSKATAATGGLNATPDKISSQISFSGTLSGLVDFGVDGPSANGGFQFLAGSRLAAAFRSAMAGQKSHGEAIDKVTVTGNTLTASTSGPDAHPVFTLTLRPVGGMWTFTLVNPIDLPVRMLNSATFFTEPAPTTLYLSGLMQAVKSTGETIALPNKAIINVDAKRGTAGPIVKDIYVHQLDLAYTAPSTTSKPKPAPKPTTYRPINPYTGYSYVTTSSSNAAIGATISLFA